MDPEFAIKYIKDAFEYAWCKETARGEWNKDVPSLNQCAVTALVINNLLGGKIIRCKMSDGDSHYYNELPNGLSIDLTSEQFSYTNATVLNNTCAPCSREYITADIDTKTRAELLQARVMFYMIIDLQDQANSTFRLQTGLSRMVTGIDKRVKGLDAIVNGLEV